MSEQPQIALIPIEERQVDFYGDSITAALVAVSLEETVVYVPVRPICNYLGLAWNGQFERLKRHPVMSKSITSVRMTRTVAGRDYDMVALPLEMLPGWLFGIDSSRVKAELQEKIIRYQAECFKVLWQAFQEEALALGERAGVETTTPATLTPSTTSLAQIRDLGLAIAQLAEQQIGLEQQVDAAGRLAADAHSRLDKAAQVVKELSERIGSVEKKIAPPTLISDEQAAEISNKVKMVAADLAERDRSKNHYQSIFAELYRRFGVTSYKRIRKGQFEAVMKFLEEWRATGENLAKDTTIAKSANQKEEKK